MNVPGVRQRHEIDAPIERVWELLTDVAGYSRWNPFVVSARSTGATTSRGTLLHLSVQWEGGGGADSTEEVTEVELPATAQDATVSALWVYRYRSWMSTIGMIRSVRTQRLSQVPGGPTVYDSEIHLTGWGAGGAPVGKIKRGLTLQAEALKAEAERS